MCLCQVLLPPSSSACRAKGAVKLRRAKSGTPQMQLAVGCSAPCWPLCRCPCPCPAHSDTGLALVVLGRSCVPAGISQGICCMCSLIGLIIICLVSSPLSQEEIFTEEKMANSFLSSLKTFSETHPHGEGAHTAWVPLMLSSTL